MVKMYVTVFGTVRVMRPTVQVCDMTHSQKKKSTIVFSQTNLITYHVMGLHMHGGSHTRASYSKSSLRLECRPPETRHFRKRVILHNWLSYATDR
jgi:hypothetical protein